MEKKKTNSFLYIAKLLIYYVLYQGLFSFIAMCVAYVYKITSTTGIVDVGEVVALSNGESDEALFSLLGDAGVWGLAVGLLLSTLMMLWHLVHFGYFKLGKSPLSQVSRPVMLLCILLIFSCMCTFNIFAQWAGLPDSLADEMAGLSHNVLGVLAIAVFAPLLEEVLFRGAIQGYLMRKYPSSPWRAIIIASLIFGVIHMNPIQIFYATMLGIVFGWIYYRTGSLVPCIIGHVLNNSLAAVTMITEADKNGETELAFGEEVAVVVVAALLSLLFVRLINKKQPAVPKPWHAVGEAVPCASDDNVSANDAECQK